MPYLMLLWNMIVFALMAIDKSRAKRRKYRISEKTLLLSIICFGAIGGILGMMIWHHKIRKWYFYGAVILSAILYLCAIKIL